MSWTAILLIHLVLCSAMMFLCRKGEKKNKSPKVSDKSIPAGQTINSKSEMQSLQIQMAELMEQNQKLKKEHQSLNESNPSGKSG